MTPRAQFLAAHHECWLGGDGNVPRVSWLAERLGPMWSAERVLAAAARNGVRVIDDVTRTSAGVCMPRAESTTTQQELAAGIDRIRAMREQLRQDRRNERLAR